jgi:hypothetical protein
MSSRKPYATDLADDEWGILAPLIPRAKPPAAASELTRHASS